MGGARSSSLPVTYCPVSYRCSIMDSKALIAEWERSGEEDRIPPTLKEFAGRLELAAVLSRLLYWGTMTGRPEGFYKSDSELSTETTLTPAQVRRLREKLVASGIFSTTLKKAVGAPTIYYLLRRETLEQFVDRWLREGLPLIKLANPFIKLTNQTKPSKRKYLARSVIKLASPISQIDKTNGNPPPGIYQIDKSYTKDNRGSKEGERENAPGLPPDIAGHPAVRIWLEVWELPLEADGAALIIEGVGFTNLEHWKNTLRGWKVAKWQPYNIDGQINRYQTKKPAPSSLSPVPTPQPEEQSAEDARATDIIYGRKRS